MWVVVKRWYRYPHLILEAPDPPAPHTPPARTTQTRAQKLTASPTPIPTPCLFSLSAPLPPLHRNESSQSRVSSAWQEPGAASLHSLFGVENDDRPLRPPHRHQPRGALSTGGSAVEGLAPRCAQKALHATPSLRHSHVPHTHLWRRKGDGREGVVEMLLIAHRILTSSHL